MRVEEVVRLAAAERAGPGALTFGSASAGKRATGSDSSGTETATAGGFSAALTDAVIRLAYGSESAISPRIPNQKRCRREPRLRRPGLPTAIEPPAVAYADVAFLKERQDFSC